LNGRSLKHPDATILYEQQQEQRSFEAFDVRYNVSNDAPVIADGRKRVISGEIGKEAKSAVPASASPA
jgi:hypothetical protein